jgi:chromosome segregation ATPase
MKNFQQNLLIALALCLCLLCLWQWHVQTDQRKNIDTLNELNNLKAEAIQGYTNSIQTMQHELSELDARITELKAAVKSNETVVLEQRREISRQGLANQLLTNQIAQYKAGVATLETRLKDAYEDVRKQNDAIKEIAAQRDDFLKKLNDAVKDRNDVVAKYNELVARFEKLQSGKAPEK